MEKNSDGELTEGYWLLYNQILLPCNNDLYFPFRGRSPVNYDFYTIKRKIFIEPGCYATTPIPKGVKTPHPNSLSLRIVNHIIKIEPQVWRLTLNASAFGIPM